MTPLAADARQRLLQHRTALQRALESHLLGGKVERELAETQAALERIDSGTYGRCEACAGAIGRQRLLALPAARYCLACAPAARERSD